jgi:MFS family permease
MLAFWRFITIVLSALALTMTSAHVLELPQKMAYSGEMYAAVNTTLYRYFAIVGGPYQIGAIVSAIVLTILVRRSRTFRWALAGTLLLIAAFASWLILVLPVNRDVAAAVEASPHAVPSLWLHLRDRWEYGHATGFVLHLAGFCALVMSITRDPQPRNSP